MKMYLLAMLLLFAATSRAGAVRSPEQQAQEFVFALHANGDVGQALGKLCKDSPSFEMHPDRLRETTASIEAVLKEFGPVQFSRLLKREDVAPVLMRLSVVSDTANGPIFWVVTFYRRDPKVEDWTIVSIRVSGSADDIVR